MYFFSTYTTDNLSISQTLTIALFKPLTTVTGLFNHRQRVPTGYSYTEKVNYTHLAITYYLIQQHSASQY